MINPTNPVICDHPDQPQLPTYMLIFVKHRCVAFKRDPYSGWGGVLAKTVLRK